jgi:IS5 family transposase
MPKQPVFPVLRNAMKKKQTRRRALFLSEMDAVVPWMRLMALITPHYPTGRAEGWTPANTAGDDATRLLPSELVCPERSDGRGDALHSEAMRRFAGIELGDDRISDETIILNFRHLLERHGRCLSK